MYDAIEVIPPGTAQDFVAELGDQFFVPNREQLDALMAELLELTRQRFDKFIRLLFEAGGEIVDAAVDTFLDDLDRIIAFWTQRLDESLEARQRLLDGLADEIALLAAQVDRRPRAFERHSRTCSNRSRERRCGTSCARRSRTGRGARARRIGRNPFYKDLPFREVKKAASDLVAGCARAAVESPLVDPVFEIGRLAQAADEILDDAQSLDPRSRSPGSCSVWSSIASRTSSATRSAVRRT